MLVEAHTKQEETSNHLFSCSSL